MFNSGNRCRFAGSFNTGTCDKTKPTHKLQELSNIANNHPGYTFCAAICECLTCGGCSFCLTSCLFYRYYAYPETPTVYTVFNCPLHGNISEVFKKTQLPQVNKNIMIYQKGRKVIAKTKVGTAIQLHIVTEDLNSTRLNTTCSVITSELSGCYDCLAGAQESIACKSERGEITAEVHCGDQLQIAICTSTGHINTVFLNFNTSRIKEKCTLSFPGGTTSFENVGELSYFNDGVLLQQQEVTSSEHQ
ncbi:hypothetical protein ANCCEY_04718 [Ancylostoma ceylanicum]|uniref:Phlebovirus glycoprotein G2 fusion domain-containing protein n=1 Tax=Ancylostoma ceylanicum TaxID=53326 RepID=A0A0D6LYA2_9BILA|nr:hypothetical protein ANCCEY_04718 [Ancylostoma ceylanicum]